MAHRQQQDDGLCVDDGSAVSSGTGDRTQQQQRGEEKCKRVIIVMLKKTKIVNIHHQHLSRISRVERLLVVTNVGFPNRTCSLKVRIN